MDPRMSPEDQQRLEELRQQIVALGGDPNAVLSAAQGQPAAPRPAPAPSNAQMAAALAGGSVGAVRVNPRIANNAAASGAAAAQPNDPRTTGQRMADVAGKTRQKFATPKNKLAYDAQLFNALGLRL